MPLHYLLPAALILLLASPAAAQVEVSSETSATDIPEVANITDLSDEGLGDDDLTTNLAAEALPTTNGIGYFWERIRDQVVTTFTFNNERKAERYRVRLHNLDRKLAACAEIGDQECVDTVEGRLAKLTDKAEEQIAKHEELAERWEERFSAWRESRETRIQGLREQALERRDQRAELRAERKANRQTARTNRQAEREEARELRQQNRTDRQLQRQDARTDRQELRQDARTDRQLQRDDARSTRQEAVDLIQDARSDRLDAANERIQIRTQDQVPTTDTTTDTTVDPIE